MFEAKDGKDCCWVYDAVVSEKERGLIELVSSIDIQTRTYLFQPFTHTASLHDRSTLDQMLERVGI